MVFTESHMARHVLRILIVLLVFLGCSAPGATSVFFFSDPMMGILALVNLLTIIMLFPVGMRVLHDYRDQLKAGNDDPVFDPAKFPDLDIDASAWEKKRFRYSSGRRDCVEQSLRIRGVYRR